ncbi:VCBS repeat-containing protein [bacterium]|nr:VCBS repeat-containing protein [bacterium]
MAPPKAFSGAFSYLYHNDGDGSFTDVSEAAGIQIRNDDTGVPLGKAMGLAPVDFNGDGWLDIVVANDTVRNFLFENNRDGTFSEVGRICGIAFDRSTGSARGAMGIDTAQFRDDGTLAIGIGNFANEAKSALKILSVQFHLLLITHPVSQCRVCAWERMRVDTKTTKLLHVLCSELIARHRWHVTFIAIFFRLRWIVKTPCPMTRDPTEKVAVVVILAAQEFLVRGHLAGQ